MNFESETNANKNRSKNVHHAINNLCVYLLNSNLEQHFYSRLIDFSWDISGLKDEDPEDERQLCIFRTLSPSLSVRLSLAPRLSIVVIAAIYKYHTLDASISLSPRRF